MTRFFAKDKATSASLLSLKAVSCVSELLLRYRYPVSLPEDVAAALGIEINNTISFESFLKVLTSTSCSPKKLFRFMEKEYAEKLFHSAVRRECFKQHTLISYYFKGGWLEFSLYFDEQSKLRRVYLRHKNLEGDGVELPLLEQLS